MKLTYFYLKSCPYCRRADEMIARLMQEEPAFREVETEKIEETEHPEIAETYDYWYVPCFFLGKEKLIALLNSQLFILRESKPVTYNIIPDINHSFCICRSIFSYFYHI